MNYSVYLITSNEKYTDMQVIPSAKAGMVVHAIVKKFSKQLD